MHLKRYRASIEGHVVGSNVAQLLQNYKTFVLSKLPRDAWLIASDVDEHYNYPCDVGRIMASLAVASRPGGGVAATSPRMPLALCGAMIDRVALDFKLHPVTLTPSIEEQFPICSELRAATATAYGGWTTKVTLLPARIGGIMPSYSGAHRVNLGSRTIGHISGTGNASVRSHCLMAGLFSHYASTAVEARLLGDKVAQGGLHAVYYGEILKKRYSVHGRSNQSDDQTAWSLVPEVQAVVLRHASACPQAEKSCFASGQCSHAPQRR